MDAGARQCDTVSSVYQRHETGVIMPTVELILRYAKGFGVDPCWLTFGKAAKIDNFRGRPGTKPVRDWRSKYV